MIVATRSIALSVALLLVAPVISIAQQYSVSEIGIPDGWAGSAGLGINNAGQVTGNLASFGNLTLHAFVATPCSVVGATLGGTSSYGYCIKDLGTLGGNSSVGYGINASGQVTGYSQTAGNAEQHAFVTTTFATGNSMRDLGTLGGTQSTGLAINDTGQVTGWSYTNGNATTYAFVTDAATNTMTDLGGFGGASSSGNGINATGQVVGSHQDSGGNMLYAFVTGPNAGGFITLDTLGGRASSGQAINASGQVTGLSEICCNNSAPHAFITNAVTNAVTDLGTFPGYVGTQGNAINASGAVVGSGYDSNFNTHGFLYSDGQMVDLNSFLPSSLAADYTIFDATGINDSGQILANACNNATGCVALVLTPMPSIAATAMTVIAGQSTTLSVSPGGPGPFTYQWFAGTSGDTSNPLAGATSATLTTPTLSGVAGATYTYWVQVTTSSGVVENSATATITVSGGTATTDGPMPLWVLAALAAGLIRIASRQLKKAA